MTVLHRLEQRYLSNYRTRLHARFAGHRLDENSVQAPLRNARVSSPQTVSNVQIKLSKAAAYVVVMKSLMEQDSHQVWKTWDIKLLKKQK